MPNPHGRLTSDHRVLDDSASWNAPTADDQYSLDAGLIRRCRAHEATAWAELVSRYERLVFTVALRNGLTREDAADVTQTTFVALLDSIDALRDDERLASWLMTVARRQSWRARRRIEQNKSVPLPTADVAAPIEDWVRIATVHEALQQLPEPCRGLIYALYFDPTGPSYAEVAQRLGRQIGGIGPMRARCLRHLRTLLGEDLACEL